MNISEQIKGMARATGSAHPMRRDDYRQPMRRAMLQDARRLLLDRAKCPPSVAGSLALQPMSAWHPKARAKVAAYSSSAS